MKFSHFLILVLAFSLMTFVSVAHAGPEKAERLGFTPHRALYQIDLVTANSGSQIVNVGGEMLYEWQPSCEAWISNHRFNLLYEYSDAPAMRITSDFSTHETFDGRKLNFTSQRKRDGQLFEEIRGHAQIKPEGAGKADFALPKDLAYNLPQGTLFPMAHTLDVLEKMAAGENFYTATVFDGGDDRGPAEINAFIGKAVNAMALINPTAEIDANMINSKARQVRLAFFPLSEPSETSDYEMTVVLHKNGVISDMVIEYDDFTVRQKLSALEALEDNCNADDSTEE